MKRGRTCFRALAFAAVASMLPLCATAQPAVAPTAVPTETPKGQILDKKIGINKASFKNAPTYIKSDSLTLNAKERTFAYFGSVEVRHGDMTMTCGRIDGSYNDKNQIQQLVAKENVFITSGNIKAQSEKALYDAASETIVMSENPELQQEGSVLAADTITIYLQEERSKAEGQVHVKLVRKTGEKGDPFDNVFQKK